VYLGLGKRYYHTFSHNVSSGCSIKEAHEDAAAYVQSYYDIRVPQAHDLVAKMVQVFTPRCGQLPSPLPLKFRRGEVEIMKHHNLERYDYNDWMLLLPELKEEVRQAVLRDHYARNTLWRLHQGVQLASQVMTNTLEAKVARAFRDKLVDLKMQSVLRINPDPTCVALPQYVVDALNVADERTLAKALVSYFRYAVTLDKAVFTLGFVERGIFRSLLTEYDALLSAKASANIQYVKLPTNALQRAEVEARLQDLDWTPRFFRHAWKPKQGESFVWGTVQFKNENALAEFVQEVARREDLPNTHVVFEPDTIKENVLERLAAIIAERRSRNTGMSRAVMLEHDRREVEESFVTDVPSNNLKLLQQDLAERRANKEEIPQWLKDALKEERRIERGFAKLRTQYEAQQQARTDQSSVVHRTAEHEALEQRVNALTDKAPKGLIGQLAKARLLNVTANDVERALVVGDLHQQLQRVAPSGVAA
jgi:hypothetical protein